MKIIVYKSLNLKAWKTTNYDQCTYKSYKNSIKYETLYDWEQGCSIHTPYNSYWSDPSYLYFVYLTTCHC